MNLFWKKTFGILKSTRRYEKREIDFAILSKKYQSLAQSEAVKEYRKVLANSENAPSNQKSAYKKELSKLRQHPDVQLLNKNFLKRNQPHRYAIPTFGDDFYWSSLDASVWNAGFYSQNKHRIQHYSFYNEKQANNQGNNTSVSEGKLRIHTKEEDVKSVAWYPEKGFVEKEFGFTSDVIQSAKSFKQSRGLFKAKLRCSGNIHHAFWLATEDLEPHINIFHFNGSLVQVGYNHKGRIYQAEIDGINPSDFYIYTLEWTKDELIWYINNMEVLRAPSNDMYREMHVTFNSFIPQKMKGEEGILEVEWVRVYQFI